MNHTKELLLKIKAAVSNGSLPAENVPVADLKQCVYSEVQVNRSLFSESQYPQVLDSLEAVCSDISDAEQDRDKLLFLLDALILCVSMLSPAVYTLANGAYWRYKHADELDNPEIEEIIAHIDRERRLSLINYDFVKEYEQLPVAVSYDADCRLRYVPYKGRRMFFPGSWTEERITGYYRSVVMEQDLRSPHCYVSERCGVEEGDVVLDIGAAEGIFSLDVIDRAGKIYLVEAEEEWIEALKQTFREDGEKVRIIHGFVDDHEEGNHFTIDSLFDGKEIHYIKMDIEGFEKQALAGAEQTLKRSENIRCAVCAYHCREDGQQLQSILRQYGFETETSKGYMCPDWTLEAYLEAELRRGVVFGKKVGRREEKDGNMDTAEQYDALIMVTAQDYGRVQRHYKRLVDNMPARRILFVGNEAVAALVRESGLGERVGFLHENDIIPFDAVHAVMKDVLQEVLGGQELPRGITGWYYQQFLKMQYAAQCKDAYYLVWDGDTVPCAPFSMFQEGSGKPYLDLKSEYHEPYFTVLSKLLPGMGKCIEKSFIAEHMLINCNIMRHLTAEIEANQSISGKTFWEKIIRSIDVPLLQANSFSEFETYGTYVAFRYPSVYSLRNWHSFRYGGTFFDPDTISDADYRWLGRDFFAISFEKGAVVREDQKNLFDNKKYQEKLTARQMLEIAQEEFKDGCYKEVWD